MIGQVMKLWKQWLTTHLFNIYQSDYISNVGADKSFSLQCKAHGHFESAFCYFQSLKKISDILCSKGTWELYIRCIQSGLFLCVTVLVKHKWWRQTLSTALDFWQWKFTVLGHKVSHAAYFHFAVKNFMDNYSFPRCFQAPYASDNKEVMCR